MSSLEEALTRPINYVRTKPKKRRGDFSQTVTASKQRFDRRLIANHLRGGEQVVMRQVYDLWVRHEKERRIVPISVAKIVSLTRWSVRHVKTIMQRLIERGWLVVSHGGCGRGNPRCFGLDLGALRKALAPDLFTDDKGCKNEAAYNKELMICRKHWWNAGLWGRDSHFHCGFVRALLADMNATWRFMVHARPKRYTLPSLSPHSMRAEADFDPVTGECYA